MKEIDPELVRKFFDGKCTPEEVHQVLLWINSKEGVSDLAEKFREFRHETVDDQEISQSVLKRIHDRIAQESDEIEANNSDNIRKLGEKKSGKSTSNKLKFGIAVSFLLTLIASVLWLYSTKEEEKLSVAQMDYLTRETVSGEKLTLKLNDGSILHLNSNSKIRFPRFFEGSRREVFMEGQVFFDVQRDESKPFVVNSRNLTVSVLGTSFAIMDDSAARLSEVAVLTGNVKVAAAGSSGDVGTEEIYLEPMYAASLDRTKGSFDKIKVDYDKAFAWKDNVLVFQNTNLEEVLKKLEHWYGVKFIQKRTINGVKDYSGRFENQTLEEVLIGLSFTYDFEYEIQDSQITIN